jgi:hypothetical protein
MNTADGIDYYGEHLEIDLPYAINLYSYNIVCGNYYLAFSIIGYSDYDSAWHFINTQSLVPYSSSWEYVSGKFKATIILNNTVLYSKYRLIFHNSFGSATTVSIYSWTLTSKNTNTSITLNNGNVNADNGIFNNILTNGNVGIMGYLSTNTGCSVTQQTDKSTNVTLNTSSGIITLNNATLNAGNTVSFTFTNSLITSTSHLIVTHIDGGSNLGSYTITATPTTGAATIYVRNNTLGNLSEAIVLRFTLLSGASS